LLVSRFRHLCSLAQTTAKGTKTFMSGKFTWLYAEVAGDLLHMHNCAVDLLVQKVLPELDSGKFGAF